ncbi:MAG: hypothetical protein LBM93_03965 [Oscillospiraceae bacterium]|nr:hypothetical protein [Oscillospiraceae bacterium]
MKFYIQSILPLTAVCRKIEKDGYNILSGNSLFCVVMASEISNIILNNELFSRSQLEKKLEIQTWENYQIYKFIPKISTIKHSEYNIILEKIKKILLTNNYDFYNPIYSLESFDKFLNSLGLIGYLDNIDKNLLQLTDFLNVETISKYVYYSKYNIL